MILNSSDGKKYLYDLVSIKKKAAVTIDLTKKETSPAKQASNSGNSNDIIRNSSQNVNSNSKNTSNGINQKNHVLHRICVLDGEGKRAKLNNEIDISSTREGASALKAEVARPFDDMSNDIISQQKRNVNYETQKERGANFNQDFTKKVVDRLAAALEPYRLAMNTQVDRQGVQWMR